LLEGVPTGMQVEQIDQALRAVPGVAGLHDLHVWALSSGRNSLSAHIVIAPEASEQAVLSDASAMLGERFHLHHTTIQVERELCAEGTGECGIANVSAGLSHAHR